MRYTAQATDPHLWLVPCPRCDHPLSTETDDGHRVGGCRNPKCHKTEGESEADG